MITEIIFTKRAKKDLEKLDRSIQKRIDTAIREKLEIDPQNHLIPLTGNFKGLLKFRVGDYRLICKKENGRLVVLVLTIQHRKEVYNTM
jgi:mRNA interferase RelE/StbE